MTTPIASSQLDTIKRLSFQALAPSMLGRVHLSVDPVAYQAGHVLQLVDRQIRVKQDSALLFIDEQPGANWGHPCRYQFRDVKTGTLIHEEKALFPPFVSDRKRLLQEFHAPLTLPNPPAPKLYTRFDWRKVLGVRKLIPFGLEQRYAVLWTSQISNARHVQDLEFLWRTLVDVFGFAQDHIYVLCYDGTINATDGIENWPGDNTPYRMQVRASATKANLQAAFDDLAKKLKPSDLLLVHTNNHGSPDGLCIDSSSVLTPAEFGTMLSGLPVLGTLVVMMEQCYSGAFSNPTVTKSTAAKTVFTSAVPANKVSAGAAQFDPFARLWIEAINGGTAYGAALPADPDQNFNGRVSMREAFQYAKAQDTTVYDDPQYVDSPANCGQHIYLGAPNLSELASLILKQLQEVQFGPIPLPDPGPERAIDRTTLIGHELSALAKAMGSVSSGG